jgi:cytidylate kinase
MNNKKLIIAIDGYSSSGKSTIAKSLAKKLGYIYIDSGAMYRAITYKLLKNNINAENIGEIKEILKNTSIDFSIQNGENIIFLDNECVEDKIRTLYISSHVSEISAIPEVREFLVKIQRELGKKGGIVMDGRDIGTVVYPNADIKFFIDADIEIRAKRRYLELKEKKGEAVNLDKVKNNLIKRDKIDSSRAHSPLKLADDAIVINTDNMTKEEQLQYILDIVKKKKMK